MKFAQQLKQLERTCAVQWRGKFIKYKDLKKMIKKCRNDAQGCSVEQVEMYDQKFFRALEAEVKAVNRNFEKAAQEVIAASKRHQSHSTASCLSFLKKPKPLDELSSEELAAASAWCRQYAIVNAAGLRKIAKKHDKYCGGSAGSRFLQSCWDAGNLKYGSFLHSPLMDELKAVEDQLASQVHHEAAKPHRKRAALSSLEHAITQRAAAAAAAIKGESSSATAQHPGQVNSPSPDTAMENASDAATGAAVSPGAAASPSGDEARSGSLPVNDMTPPRSELQEDSFICPICLEPMYLPLGLTCGHKFCTECVLHAAGLEGVHGSLKAVLAVAPPDAACPECRQKGVFQGALLMKKLGQAINRRYPKEMRQHRREAMHKRISGLKPPWYDKADTLMAPFAAGL